ncbi:methyltransferase [Streptomyces litchfieldiae]|uniref:Methyltransferase n=1 Tax=Streptomyces litchfieldiae TaxID=3075543 RepID=A0ABU2MX08_9ACTN|nr:methyltransferase [Streptomyces sp. DSM 44938]MDT0345823.1 methyltransferase [Streptomyces sp. DSM 44938]
MSESEQEFQDRVEKLCEDIFGFLFPSALRTAIRLDVPDHLAKGPRTAAELAELNGANAAYLERVLRYLATRNVFREDEAGRFHMTPEAELFRSDAQPSLRDFALVAAHEVVLGAAARLYDGVVKGKTVFEDVHGVGLFEYMSGNPEFAQSFDKGMSAFSDTENPVIAASYEFPAGATVVDVGGGRGGLLRSVLEQHEGVKGILLDRDHVVAGHMLDVPELAGRWEAVGGDFLESVPAGGDYYVIKHVLHNWSEEDGLRILDACRRAMAEGGRILVVDAVIPRDNAFHPGKTQDLMMMPIVDGQELTKEGFQALFAKAGFKLTRIIDTPSHSSIVEGITE